MLRKLIIGFAAAAAIGAAAVPMSASATGTAMAAGTVVGRVRLRTRTPTPYFGGCCRNVRVSTPYGWRGAEFGCAGKDAGLHGAIRLPVGGKLLAQRGALACDQGQ